MPERALWVAVPDAVILDDRKGKLEPDYVESADFAQVAALAGLDPAAARDALAGLAKHSC